MARKPILHDEPPGDFKSTTITMSGKTYKMVEVRCVGEKYLCTLKNSSGEYKEFNHDELLKIIDPQ